MCWVCNSSYDKFEILYPVCPHLKPCQNLIFQYSWYNICLVYTSIFASTNQEHIASQSFAIQNGKEEKKVNRNEWETMQTLNKKWYRTSNGEWFLFYLQIFNSVSQICQRQWVYVIPAPSMQKSLYHHHTGTHTRIIMCLVRRLARSLPAHTSGLLSNFIAHNKFIYLFTTMFSSFFFSLALQLYRYFCCCWSPSICICACAVLHSFFVKFHLFYCKRNMRTLYHHLYPLCGS